MTLTEIVLRVTHDCPFGNISRKFASLKMFVWCNREHEVIEVVLNNQKDYSAVVKELSKIGAIVDESPQNRRVQLISRKCLCTLQNSVGRNIDALNLLHVLPTMYESGWEYYRMIAFRHEDFQELLQRLERMVFAVEVLRKVPFDGFIASSLTLTADALFSDLTEKQLDALLAAYDSGYYNLPRKADIKEISRKRKVPRTTFQEHLKKGENKLISSLVPYMQLFKQAAPERREGLRMKQRKAHYGLEEAGSLS